MNGVVEGICCDLCKKFSTKRCPVLTADPWSRFQGFCHEYEPNGDPEAKKPPWLESPVSSLSAADDWERLYLECKAELDDVETWMQKFRAAFEVGTNEEAWTEFCQLQADYDSMMKANSKLALDNSTLLRDRGENECRRDTIQQLTGLNTRMSQDLTKLRSENMDLKSRLKKILNYAEELAASKSE